MKKIILGVLFLSTHAFSEEPLPDLPVDILLGRWQPIYPVEPEFKSDEIIVINNSTISWMGCQPVKYHFTKNFEASDHTMQYDNGPIITDFRVRTIHLDYEGNNSCLHNFKYIEFAFWVKGGSPETGVFTTLYESPQAWYEGKNYQTTISKI